MANCDKLLQKARESPAGLRFEEACQLAECYGFDFSRQKGSHRIYKCPGRKEFFNLQPDKSGKAKSLQVKQILDIIADTSDN